MTNRPGGAGVVKLPARPRIEVAPSILSADFGRLAEHVGEVADQVRMLHLDVMDGHLVPNLTIGPVVVKWLRGRFAELFFDTHLMITNPLQFAEDFVKAGADGITFHLEIGEDPRAVIARLRDLGVSVGVSIRPRTPVAALEPIVALVDMVLLMTVEPGFGGQAFLPESPARARQLRSMLRDDQRLEVDGGIDAETVAVITAAGADTLVAGNAIFGQADPVQAVRAILDGVRQYQPTAQQIQ